MRGWWMAESWEKDYSEESISRYLTGLASQFERRPVLDIHRVNVNIFSNSDG